MSGKKRGRRQGWEREKMEREIGAGERERERDRDRKCDRGSREI